MLKDITLGQFFPGDSVIHRMDPRYKIIVTIVFIMMIFVGNSFWSLLVGGVYLLRALPLSNIPLRVVQNCLNHRVPILLFTAALDVFFIEEGDTLWQWHFLTITEGGVATSIFMVIRIILLILGSSLLTYTTSPILLTDAIEELLKPLKRVNFPVHDMAMMMSIALRFIPTLIEETDKIMQAQKARGATLDQGKITERVKAIVPIIVPLFVSAFRRAEELATAMECRCYRGGEGRTRMRQLKAHTRDYFALFMAILLLCASVILNYCL